MKTTDSAQLVSFFGAVISYVGGNYDKLAAAACALVCAGYTIWRWRHNARIPRNLPIPE